MNMANNSELKEAVKFLADAELLVSDLSDGFSFSEITRMIAVGGELPAVVKDASVMFPEWAALDDASRADLVAYVQANCKFPANVMIDVWVKKVLSAVVVLSSIYKIVVS